MTPWATLETMSRAAVEQMALVFGAGTAIALCAWLLLKIAPRRDSSARFALWFSALIAMAALPAAGLLWTGRPAAAAAPLVTLPEHWATILFAVWAAIASLGLLRVAFGYRQLLRLRAGCEAVALSTLDPAVANALNTSTRKIELCTSASVRVPTAIGFRNPAIVMPEWLLAEMPTHELRQVILHERAHLERRDDWTNLAQKIVRALLFFHPAAWWIESQLTLEREMACDDAVLALSEHPRRYAECLARLAERTLGRRGAELAQAAVSRMRQTSLRVAQILDASRPRPTRAWTLAVTLAVMAATITGISAQRAHEWIGFSSREPAIRAAAAAGGSSEMIPAYIHPAKFVAPAPPTPAPCAMKSQARLQPRPKAVLKAETRKSEAMMHNVSAPQAEAAPAMVLTVFTTEDAAHLPRVIVVMWWDVTVQIPTDPPAKQIPQKST